MNEWAQDVGKAYSRKLSRLEKEILWPKTAGLEKYAVRRNKPSAEISTVWSQMCVESKTTEPIEGGNWTGRLKNGYLGLEIGR